MPFGKYWVLGPNLTADCAILLFGFFNVETETESYLF